jgi:hypothetical protein
MLLLALHLVTRALGPKLTVTEGYGSTVFRYLPSSTFLVDVQGHGVVAKAGAFELVI